MKLRWRIAANLRYVISGPGNFLSNLCSSCSKSDLAIIGDFAKTLLAARHDSAQTGTVLVKKSLRLDCCFTNSLAASLKRTEYSQKRRRKQFSGRNGSLKNHHCFWNILYYNEEARVIIIFWTKGLPPAI